MKVFEALAVRTMDGVQKVILIEAKNEKDAEKKFFSKYGEFWVLAQPITK